jgi:hypothetical protein
MATTPVAQRFALPATMPPPPPKRMLGMDGVDTEMFTCLFRAMPLVVQLLSLSQGGVNHPARLTERVRQQIKRLTLWRSPFYGADFRHQPAMSSFKELDRVYKFNCYQYNGLMGLSPHGELALFGANVALTPWLKRGGCGNGLLMTVPRREDYGNASAFIATAGMDFGG